MVSVFDRGFTYGDGLFETMRVVEGKPFRWDAHLERLNTGADFLGIALPLSPEKLRVSADELITENQLSNCVLRLMISRGVGTRGYSPRSANSPTVVMTTHPAEPPPPSRRLMTSSHVLKSGDPLLRYKTCNKLMHVLARQEAERAGFDEALLVNDLGHPVSATSANLFWIVAETVCTCPVNSGALPGVTRAILRNLCAEAGIAYVEKPIAHNELTSAEGVFLTSSTAGIVPVSCLGAHALGVPKLVQHLAAGYARLDY